MTKIQAPAAGDGVRVDWTQIDDHDHFVQFYESDPLLVETLRGYIATGLRRGEVGIVIATEEHRLALETRLGGDGDVEEARRFGRYISLDADQTLEKFMVGGMPDASRFTREMDAVLGVAFREGRKVRAFGEMVALLWSRGQRAAALQLEELWNELARTYSFTLFCAYPAQGFSGADDGRHQICGLHTRMLPAESSAA